MRKRKTRHAPPARTRPTKVSASVIKNAFHEYLERVSRTREEIVITRYGRPIARLAPVESTPAEPRLVGCMAGTVSVLGDLIAPIDVQWEADA